ncbi:MAG TPA: hypothetical protein PLV68_07660, partial [Ilumatobacteraceae bacterium]|nr:hypothetical protein [Ilumatobacteraceae bacterium]
MLVRNLTSAHPVWSRLWAVAILVGLSLTGSVAEARATGPVGAPLGSLGFVAVQPARLLDTRAGFQTIDELSAGVGAVGAGEQLSVRVAGRAGIPASHVSAVVLNVTAVDATERSFLT